MAVTESISIKAPNIKTLEVTIEGTAPYVQNKFSHKAMEQMKAKHIAGDTAKGKRAREPKNFQALYEGAIHRTNDGWIGIPAAGFRNACISACRTIGYKMTHAKLAIFVEADGFDSTDGSPLVKITKGDPKYVEHVVRNETGVPDVRPRPMWDPGWQAVVRISFDADMFSQNDVVNLFSRVGLQVGIGEGRPDSSNSEGMGWGTFRILGDNE
jgi:hypothetical protein